MSRILVIDDDADLRAVAKAVLSSVPHHVVLAENAYEALKTLRVSEDSDSSQDFDLVISDANMPNMTGFELIRRMKASPKTKNIPVALLTARRDRQDIEKAMQLGVDDYIIKPLDPLIFLKKVDALLQKKEETEDMLESTFTDEEMPVDVVIPVKGSIIAVSELGVKLQTNYPLVESDRISLNTQLFRTIGVTTPHFKVVKVEPSQRNGIWTVHLHFVGVGDSTLQKIRGWIQQRVLKTRRSA